MIWIRAFPLAALVALIGCAGSARTRPEPHALPLGSDLAVEAAPRTSSSPPAEAATPRAGRVVTLPDALALALRHNPDLASATFEVDAARARVLQAGLFPNPEIEVETEELWGGGALAGFGASETTVGIAQAIPIGGRLGDGRRVEALGRESAGWEREARRLEVYAATVRAFAAVLAAQERLGAGEQSVRLGEGVLRSVTGQVDAGKVAPLEASKARVELSLLRLQRDRLARALESRRRELAATWGSPDPAFEVVEGRLDRLRTVPSEHRLEVFLGENPEVARQSTEVARHEAALDLARAEAIPDLVLRAGVQRVETDETAYLVGLSLDLPLFDRNQGGIAEARAELGKARVERNAAITRIRMEFADALGALVLATGQARALRDEVVPAARAAFEATRASFEQGKSDLLDVLDAQRTLVEAEGELVDALEEHHSTAAEVERLVGRSLDTLGDELDDDHGNEPSEPASARKEPDDGR